MSAAIPIEPVLACDNCKGASATEIARSPDFEYRTCDNEFAFVSCDACGLVYLRDRPATSTLDIIYPPTYIPYEFNEHLGSLLAKARNYVQAKKVAPIEAVAPKDALIVDVGCGSGEFLRILKRSGPSTWRLAGVDIADKAMENLAAIGIEGVQGRFEALDWPLPAPDVIVMNQVIEHLDQPSAVVRRSMELLKPGGALVIETPSVNAWDAHLFKKRHWGGWHTPRHWTLYSPKSLGALLEGAGFEVVSTAHILSPNFWLQSMHHWLSEKGPMSKKIAPYFDVKNLIPLCAASGIDVVQLGLRGTTSNFRMIARKPIPAGFTAA